MAAHPAQAPAQVQPSGLYLGVGGWNAGGGAWPGAGFPGGGEGGGGAGSVQPSPFPAAAPSQSHSPAQAQPSPFHFGVGGGVGPGVGFTGRRGWEGKHGRERDKGEKERGNAKKVRTVSRVVFCLFVVNMILLVTGSK